MPARSFTLPVLLYVWVAAAVTPVSAQILETVGSRALGMGGAFVAVASDSSATWWNPAGPAVGPFLDIAWGGASTQRGEARAIRKDTGSWFALAIPPFGFGYYRLRITDIRPSVVTTGQGAANREDRGAGVPIRSLSASQVGVTLVHSLFSGVHAGTTLKYVRGSVDDGNANGSGDLDVGVVAVAGSLRVGGVVRNLREAEFADASLPGKPMRLPRQARVGAAFTPEDATGVPLTISLDADVRRYSGGTADRRGVALGAEQWFMGKRLGVRAGGRFNTVADRERSATGGLTVSVRTGVYVDGHVVRGGSADERGWGLAGRVSF